MSEPHCWEMSPELGHVSLRAGRKAAKHSHLHTAAAFPGGKAQTQGQGPTGRAHPAVARAAHPAPLWSSHQAKKQREIMAAWCTASAETVGWGGRLQGGQFVSFSETENIKVALKNEKLLDRHSACLKKKSFSKQSFQRSFLNTKGIKTCYMQWKNTARLAFSIFHL